MDCICKHHKTNHDVCNIVEQLFYDVGIPACEQVTLWKIAKGTVGCRRLIYSLLKLKQKTGVND